jgi:hypothetical protein
MKKKKVVLTAYEAAVQEFHRATEEYLLAQENFSNALPEYFDIANRELTIAKVAVDTSLKKVKRLSKELLI